MADRIGTAFCLCHGCSLPTEVGATPEHLVGLLPCWMRKETYLRLRIHVGPLVDKDLGHIHSVFLSSQVEWGETALQEIPRAWPSVIARVSARMWLYLRSGL